MGTIVTITLPFFALIGCGYLAGRLGMLPEPGVAGLNLFVFYFALPAMLFRTMAFRSLEQIVNWPFLAAWALAGLSVFLLVLAAARLLLGSAVGEAALLALVAEFPNSGYLGLPLVATLLGEPAAVPVALTIVVDLTVSLSLTLALVEWGRARRRGWLKTGATVFRSVLLNPFILSILAGIAVAALKLPLPTAFDRFTALLGTAAGPGALFALGATLGVRPYAGGARAVALAVTTKLVLHPLAVGVAMVFIFRVEPYWVLAALLTAAIPSASNVYVLAQRYELYVGRVSTAILVSTALAVFTFIGFTRLLGL